MTTRIYLRDQNDVVFDVIDHGEYFGDTINRYLQGKASIFTLKIIKRDKDYQRIKAGIRISFMLDDGEEFWMNCVKVEQDEKFLTMTCLSLGLELNNEKIGPYKSPKAMSIAEYIDVIDFEKVLTIRSNEVSDKKISYEWTGTESQLARLFSLAKVFSAEIEFSTKLNSNGTLKSIIVDIYKEHDDKNQGIGNDRRTSTFYFGEEIKTIRKTEDIYDLYTCILPTGENGLTISNVEKEVFDDDGNLLYATYRTAKPDFPDVRKIYAVQAREQFPSTTSGNDRWIAYSPEQTQYKDENALYGYALSELKKNCVPKVTWEIEGYIDAKIGDTVRIADESYTPTLYLEARIVEQEISITDKTKNKSTFSNVKELESQISSDLLAQMIALIEENKTFDVQISTTNGYSFKNGFGETTLTARVMDGPKDVTNEFSLTWFKNGTEYSHDASIIVRAGSIDELATFLIIAEKDGRERGRNELTVFNVKDGSPGKTPVVHLAWADSADGSVGFSLELPTTKIPKYRGYYVDYSTEASTNPKVYKWERNPDDAAKVADEAKDKADAADSKADSAIDTANSAKDTADEASKQTALVNGLANTAKELADKANADAAEANRLLGLANTEISKLNTNVNNVRSDLASAETELNSKIETVKTTLTQDYATKTNLSETQLTLNKTITDSVASVKQEMSEKYAVKSDLTTLQGEYNSFKEDTAKKISQQVSSIETVQTNTTEAQKLAGEAYNKAQSAATSATNASSTANSALDKASDATSVANSANQNATSAVANANAAVSAANTAKNNADKAIADVAALTKTVSSQSTKIDQTSNRIDLVASSITEVGNKLDNLQVGGRNYFSLTHLNNISPSSWVVNAYVYNFTLEPNTEYILSSNVPTGGNPSETVLYFNGGGTPANGAWLNNPRIMETNNEGKFYIAIPTGRTYTDEILNGKYWVKLEKGNKATDWSPALEDQQAQIDNIQVGGRNLLTKDILSKFRGNALTNNSDGSITTHYYYQNDSALTNLKAGNTLTFSCKLKKEGDFAGKVRIGIYHDGAWDSYYMGSLLTRDYKMFSKTITMKKDGVIGLVIQNDNGSSTDSEKITFKELKLEIGNKVTDYSPAPEDTQDQIDGINNNLTNNYYQKTTVDSKISTATSGITAQYTKDINTRLGNYYDKSTIDSKLTIDGQGITTYVKNTKSKLDNLQVGGRNLLLQTGFFTGGKLSGIVGDSNKINLSKTIITDANSPSGKAYRINKYKKGTENINGGCYWVMQKQLTPGKKYTWSAYVRGVGTVNTFGPEQGGAKAVALTSTWTKVSHTFTANSNKYYQFTFYSTSEFDLYLTDLMLEEGTTPSPWSPAPEDFPTLTQYTEVKQQADRISSTVYDSSTGLTTKVNQLAGKYAITALNSAGDILASLNLNANTSTAEINAKLIRLNGYTKMDDAFVNNLVANSILTNKIKATEISGDYIKGGTIDGSEFTNDFNRSYTSTLNRTGTTKLSGGKLRIDYKDVNKSTGAVSANGSYMEYSETGIDFAENDGTATGKRLELNSNRIALGASNGAFYADPSKMTLSGNGYFQVQPKYFLGSPGNSNYQKFSWTDDGFELRPVDVNGNPRSWSTGIEIAGNNSYVDFKVPYNSNVDYDTRIILNQDKSFLIENAASGKPITLKTYDNLRVFTDNALIVRSRLDSSWRPVLASGFSQQSDEKWKYNIKDMPSRLKQFKNLDFKAYRLWAEDGKYQEGIIASDNIELPFINKGYDGYAVDTYAYATFIGKAAQEYITLTDKTINELKNENAELKSKVDNLTTELETIKQQLDTLLNK